MYTISKRRDREKTYLDVPARPISPPTIPSVIHLRGIDLPAKKVGQDPIAMKKLKTSYNFRACFIRVTSIYRYAPSLGTVYNPNVGAKGDALTKSSTAHRTPVGFLSIVYSPNVYAKVPSR